MSTKQRTNPVTAGTQTESPLQESPAPTQGTATLGRELRRRRGLLGLSLSELAQRVGCTKSYLSAIECAKKGPPTPAMIARIESALECEPGQLLALAQLEQTPTQIRADLESLKQRDCNARLLARLLKLSAQQGASLDELYGSGMLRAAIEQIDPGHGSLTNEQPLRLAPQVPLINKVTAGYPADFTDLDYPARVADEYIRTPDLNDPDAFAARVVGDSMEPNYREGDIVVFSPLRAIESGADCFVRLEPDAQSTFKRVYFERDDAGNELIRIQPINNAYAPRTVPREQVAGLYAGVSVIRSIG
ncbi:MAG: helix-turn-helix domain-containing protein [Phycisphaerales bacterium]|nr:helix-turn-helix domain-containing protein [Phycisphaerales bacterium]